MAEQDDLIAFLQRRGVNGSILKALEEEKIDCCSFLEMDDEDMKAYLPALGDRLAAKAFCRLKCDGQTEETQSLLAKIRNESGQKRKSLDHENPSKQMKKNAEKTHRMLELGWLYFDKGLLRQVRSQNGGGTRKVLVHKNAKQDDLIKTTIELFFPYGQSNKGSIRDFDFAITDFRGCEMGDCTVGGLYEHAKSRTLRLYLCTKRTTAASSNSQGITDRQVNQPTTSYLQEIPNKRYSENENSVINFGRNRDVGSAQLEETLPLVKQEIVKVEDDDDCNLPDCGFFVYTNTDVVPQAEAVPQAEYFFPADFHPADVPPTEAVLQAEDFPSAENAPEAKFVLPAEPVPQAEAPSPAEAVPEAEVVVKSEDIPLSEAIPQAGAVPSAETVHVYFHRVNVVSEMIALFKTPEILTTNLHITFVGEAGEDVSGVLGKAYILFWKTFLSRYADGEDYMIPLLNPEYGLEEWKAIGRILSKGYQDYNFFPFKLAPAFFIAIMFDEEAAAAELIDSFLMYMSTMEREAVKQALDEQPLTEDSMEILEELLHREGSYVLPTSENIRPLIQKIAHKCIIQKSMYALQGMKRVVQAHLTFPDVESIKKLYNSLSPTAKRV